MLSQGLAVSRKRLDWSVCVNKLSKMKSNLVLLCGIVLWILKVTFLPKLLPEKVKRFLIINGHAAQDNETTPA